MSDPLMQQLSKAREHVAAELSPAQIEQGLSGLEQRIQRRRRLQRSARALGGVAAVLLAVLFWQQRVQTPVELARQMTPSTVLTTQDGSRATKLSAQTELRVEHDAADEVALALVRGKGHFKVTPDKQRAYRVRAGDVVVQVLGTAFEVERVGSRTRVQVEHGVVRVSWRGGETTLYAGGEGLFPPLAQALAAPEAATSEAAPALVAAPEPAPLVQEVVIKREHVRQPWRALARAGKHQEAFGSLGHEAVDDLDGLLLAADAARLSGHPREAARYLQRLVERYPQSAPAHLAAFTLGRLALYELKRPGLAAQSFARAYSLNPTGPLAEDALAREAEAYHRAGNAERTKSAVERYLARFPAGARREELSRYLDGQAAAPAP